MTSLLPLSRRALMKGATASLAMGAWAAGSARAATQPAAPFIYILLGRRRPGMSMAAFRNYYEDHHSKLILTLKGAPLDRYIRRYLHPQAHLDPASTGKGHDFFTELWTKDQAEMDALMARFEPPEVSHLFSEDEKNLFDTKSLQVYRLEERETDLAPLSSAARDYARDPSGPVVKSVLIAYRRPGMNMAQFQDYYENHHRKVIEYIDNPPLIRYVRRYLHPVPGLYPDEGADTPSVVMEMWYRSRADMDRLDRAFYASDKVDYFIEDEARLFDRPRMKYYVSEDRESDLSAMRKG